jgi:hypothetical protein
MAARLKSTSAQNFKMVATAKRVKCHESGIHNNDEQIYSSREESTPLPERR